MNIVAIGHQLEQTVLACGGTLLKNIQWGGKSHLIILQDKKESKKIIENHKKINITIQSIENFDFSNVTQKNVVQIKNAIDIHSPDTIIIPFNKSNSKNNSNVSQSSILAGRNIKNILMYEKNENKNFVPTVFERTASVYDIKTKWIKEITKSKKYSKEIENFNKKNTKYGLKFNKFEPLQSLRLVLNENGF